MIFELRHCAERLLGGTGQDQLALVAQVQLVRWNSDIVRAYAEKTTRANDTVRNIAFRRDDDVFDLTDLLAFVVVDVLPEELTTRAPTLYDVVQLNNGDTEPRFSGRLRRRTCRSVRHEQCRHRSVQDL